MAQATTPTATRALPNASSCLRWALPLTTTTFLPRVINAGSAKATPATVARPSESAMASRSAPPCSATAMRAVTTTTGGSAARPSNTGTPHDAAAATNTSAIDDSNDGSVSGSV